MRGCYWTQIHTEGPGYDHQTFKPWRIQALAFRTIRRLYPDYPLWRDFAYEYEHDELAIDVINGGLLLREWVDDAGAAPQRLYAWPWGTSRLGWVSAKARSDDGSRGKQEAPRRSNWWRCFPGSCSR